MGLLQRLFGGGEQADAPRRLSHPRDLRSGDIIKFRFLDQPDISGNEFEVSQINTYIYGDLCYPELVLKDRVGHLVYLMVEEEDGEEYLALSKKVNKADVNELLPNAVEIMARGTGTKVEITQKPEGFETWLVNKYEEVDDNVKGAFVKGDARYLSDEELNRQERFTSHIIEDKEGEFALELEIYDTGETELSVTVYHDINEIEEMWPGRVAS